MLPSVPASNAGWKVARRREMADTTCPPTQSRGHAARVAGTGAALSRDLRGAGACDDSRAVIASMNPHR